MRAKKTHWFRNTLLVLIVCAILGIGLSVVLFLSDSNSSTYASANIQFSFDGAASGVAPNGYRFDINNIFSEEVIDQALKDSGMSDRYTATEIHDQLLIRGDYPKDINEQMMNYDSVLDFSANRALSLASYHPTLFEIDLYNDFDKTIARTDLEKLLNQIMISAKQYFTKVYAVSMESTSIEYNLSDYDYTHQLTMLSRAMNRTLVHAQALYKDAPLFLYNGCNFNDIAIRLENLFNNDIDRLNANIIMSAVTKDADRLLMQYQYELVNLSIELDKQNECLTNLDKLINSYQKNEILYLASGESFTKIDGNSSETYDALVAQRKSVADDITEINRQIDLYTLQMNDLIQYNGSLAATVQTDAQKSEDTADDESETSVESAIAVNNQISDEVAAQRIADMEANIAFISEQYQKILTDFAELIQNYNAEILNDSTVQIINGRYRTKDLISGEFIVKLIKTAGPICAVGFIVCLVLIIISRRKEQIALLLSK